MALFDSLMNLSPEQNQGLLQAAASLLQSGAPNIRPVGFGEVLSSGLHAYNQSLQDAQDRGYQNQIRGLQLQELQGTASDKERARQEAERLRQFYVDRAQGAADTGPTRLAQAQQVLGSNLAPTQANADLLTAAQPSQPASAQAQQQPSLYQQRLSEAQSLRNAGFHAQADVAENAALKFAPKVKGWEKVQQNGRILYAPFFEDGTSGNPVPLDVAEKLQEVNLGGTTQLAGEFSGTPVKTLTRTATPGELMTDARLREQNNIAQGGKVATVSTSLRKEFDDLPEVKNYKQALPAYNAIVDASKRNTTQSDINLVYGIAKLYDPNSVVREGEYNTVANSPNIPERIKGYAQYIQGGGRLTPAVKAQILQEANGRIGSFEDQYSQARSNYADIATRSGGDKSLLFPSEFKSARQPQAAPSQGKTATLADIAETARKSGRPTEEVTRLLRERGYKIGGQ